MALFVVAGIVNVNITGVKTSGSIVLKEERSLWRHEVMANIAAVAGGSSRSPAFRSHGFAR